MSHYGIDLGNFTDTFNENFHEDNFDPVRARNVMAIICSIYFDHNPMDIDPGLLYCNATYDSFSCWPATKAGDVARISCPDLSFTNHYKNTTRFCSENGTWDRADYNSCMVKDSPNQYELKDNWILQVIYFVGYAITTVSLLLALAIFFYFRSLRCLRNTIHCHLMVAFLLNNVSYIIMARAFFQLFLFDDGWLCRTIMFMVNYFMNVPFFWMFVEGLYLFTTVVWAFSLQKIRLWYYILIGWGAPLLTTLTWAIVKAKYHDLHCWIPLPDDNKHVNLDFIMYGPIILIIVVNGVFIVGIVYVLLTKLKASNTLETRRYRKAARATFVLLPLLGVTFMVFIFPIGGGETVKRIHYFLNTILQSLQGLFVSIIYCFMNGEVKTVLRKKFMSIKDSRSLTRYTKSSIFSSPHRSSGYAMHQLSAPSKGGKPNCDAKISNNDRRFSRLSRTEESETDAYTSMIENVT